MQRIVVGLGLVALVAGVGADAAPTLKDAIDGAWAKHPVAQAHAARREQHGANRDAAGAWLAAPPRASLQQHTDRWNSDAGAREVEADLTFPLTLPAARNARVTVADRESAQYDASALVEKWRLAGEVRETLWTARLAANELAVTQRKVEEANALAADVDRRFKAGDVARTDLNQARAAVQLAELDAAQAKLKASRASQAFQVMTGLKALPPGAESPVNPRPAIDAHVQLAALSRQVDAARARLDEAGANRRDPPELSVGTRRERSARGEPDAGSLLLRLTIPFATNARNQPKIAGASADLIEAQAKLQLERARLSADVAASEDELAQTSGQVDIAKTRLALIAENHALFDKAYKLGQIDLATRLRAEAERFDAQLALSRTELEHSRAIARLHHALGILP
jgi:cobalt-zinc-cadmium efflux system outer membrane protein